MPRRTRIKTKPNSSFTPKPLIITFLTTTLLLLVTFSSPTSLETIPLFFALLFITLSFALSIFIKDTRRTLTFAFALCFFLVLRYFDLGNALNLLLLIGAIAAFEYFLSNHK